MLMNGVRNGWWRPGSVRRITITAIDTAAKAKSVPEFEIFASCPTGKKAANRATAIPVRIVMTCGVLNLGWIFEKVAGNRPSRLITKKMRVWPNIIIRMTEGSARPAARPIRLPIWGQPISRSVQASASFEQTTA